jgi:hypothetical protein
MQPTPYADVNALLESLRSHLQRIFQEKLVGLYLYGSLTAGDFDPGISDVDLLAVTSTDVTGAEFEALRAMHGDIDCSNPEWDDRIEVVYLSSMALSNFRLATGPIVISPGEPFHVREDEPLLEWLELWYIIRETGVTLFGPSPDTIIPPIAKAEFVQWVRKYAASMGTGFNRLQDRKNQAYAILTMCRALYTFRSGGEQISKRQAALWAQRELPEWAWLIWNALAWREAWREEGVDHQATYGETVRFIAVVKGLIGVRGIGLS